MRDDCGCWIKIFKDGTKEQGSDSDIQAGKASWSKGRQKEIKEVLLFDGFLMANLSVPDTEWYQFDRYISSVAVGKNISIRTHRVVQAKIKEHHVGSYFVCTMSNSNLMWAVVQEDDNSSNYDFKKEIINSDVGKWCSIVLRKYKNPFAMLSDRGKLNG